MTTTCDSRALRRCIRRSRAIGRSLILVLIALALPMATQAQQRPAPIRAIPHSSDGGLFGPTAHEALLAAPVLQDGGRQTKRGMIIGAIAGSVVGLAIGGFIHVYCEAEGDDCGAVIPVMTVLGAAGGAAAGAIVGAAIPRDADDASPPDTVRAPAPPAPRRIGSLYVASGIASATVANGLSEEFTGSGSALRVGFAAELRPWFALGGEAGQAWLGEAGNIRHLAVAVRGTVARATISPFVSANLGAYDASRPSLEFLGGALGIGARVTPSRGRRYFIDVEARASRNAQNIEPMRMRTLSLGGGVYW